MCVLFYTDNLRSKNGAKILYIDFQTFTIFTT